jgi:predicted RNA-binding Zn-ribbon protein involved in translation (DUF1610 family)
MSNATESAPAVQTAAAEPASRGILLPCPKCGEMQATLDFNLADGVTFHCQDCDDTFEADDLRERIAAWTRVLAWVDAMPCSD